MQIPDNTQRILTQLKDFRSIESLKKLFWVELNYEQDNTPIGNLPEGISELVAANPLRFATAGKNNDFHVIYTKLKTEKLRKTDERKIISYLQSRYPDTLYIFSNSAEEQWHFINVKLTREKTGGR